MKAWQETPGIIRDVAHGDPFALYHPSIAAFYTTDVPDGTVNGATLVNGAWVNPTPAPAPVPTGPSAQELKAAGSAAIQNLLDSTAQAHGYDDLERCISYIGDPDSHWDAEGTRAKLWRHECWSKAKQIQDNATAGNWPTAGAGKIPTLADVLAAMPPANWPA